MKALICIGAGKSQQPVISTAKELGYAIIAIDQNPSAPGFKIADEKLVLSTFDAIPFMVDNKFAVLLIGLFFVLQFITYKNIFTKEKIANYKNRYWFGIITIITVLIFFLASRDPGNFIYFQF